MGRPRQLHRRLTLLLALALAGCGSGGDDLLRARPIDDLYTDGAGGYGPTGSGTGTIAGTVTFQGRPYPSATIDVSKDKLCLNLRPSGIASENFRFDAGTGALEGVIVYVKKGLSAAEPPSEPVVLDQKGCQYVPHLAVVQTGQPLVIRSSDDFLHNVRGAPGPNEGFNHAMSRPGDLAPKVFNRQEVAKRIGCDVHGWMVSYVAVIPHAAHFVTGADGTYKLENVPEGEYVLGFWHEELRERTVLVTVAAGGTATADLEFTR